MGGARVGSAGSAGPVGASSRAILPLRPAEFFPLSPVPHSPFPHSPFPHSRCRRAWLPRAAWAACSRPKLGPRPPLSIGGTNAGCSRPAGFISDHGKAGAPPIFATRRISNFALITDHRPGTHSRVMQISQTRHVRPVGRAPPIEVASSWVKAVPQCIGLDCVSLALSLSRPGPFHPDGSVPSPHHLPQLGYSS